MRSFSKLVFSLRGRDCAFFGGMATPEPSRSPGRPGPSPDTARTAVRAVPRAHPVLSSWATRCYGSPQTPAHLLLGPPPEAAEPGCAGRSVRGRGKTQGSEATAAVHQAEGHAVWEGRQGHGGPEGSTMGCLEVG